MSRHKTQAYGQDLCDRVLSVSGSTVDMAARFRVSMIHARSRSATSPRQDAPGVQCGHVPSKLNGLEQALPRACRPCPARRW